MTGGIAAIRNIPCREYRGPRLTPEEARRRVRISLGRDLTARQREAVVRYFLRGQNLAEQAAMDGVNKSTVWRNFHRGMARLRRGVLSEERIRIRDRCGGAPRAGEFEGEACGGGPAAL